MIKYNSTYDRWVTDDGLVYRQDKPGAFVLCKQSNINGYANSKSSRPSRFNMLVHLLVWETFKGSIPRGFELDHLNTIRNDNRLENLRCVTKKENQNNPLTRKHMSDIKRGKASNNKGKTWSEFGNKFKEHFGITCYENPKLYSREQKWYSNHNHTCRWECK